MKKQALLVPVIISGLLFVPVFIGAITVDEIKAQIEALRAQIAVLQSQSPQNQQGATISCPNLIRNLSRGSRGEDVKQLQQFLISQNLLAPDSGTGFFGALTEAAVKKFQARNDIVSSGSPATTGYGAVGPRTRATLAASCRVQAAAPPTPTSPNPTQTIPPVSILQTTTTVPPAVPTSPVVLSCTPLSPQTQTLACPSGQTGSITQTRTSSCPGSTWSSWTTTSNTCATLTTSPLPPVTPTITICSNLSAFNASNSDASPTLQACLDSSATSTVLELPTGRYTIGQQIHINKPLNLRTQGKTSGMARCELNDASCAELIGDANFKAIWGLILVNTHDLKFDHIIINGNKEARALTENGRLASRGEGAHGHNLMVLSCSNCEFTNNVLKNGVGATAFGYGYVNLIQNYFPVNDRDTLFRNNLIAYNGSHKVTPTTGYSDGFTLHDGTRLTIVDNELIDNSDIDFLIGGCIDCIIQRNKITHTGAADGASWAGMGFQTWVYSGVQTSSGDYTGTDVSNNTIDCSLNQRCGFGLYLGNKAWGWDAQTLKGGSFHDNAINGAQQGVNVDQIQGARFYNNIVTNSGGTFRTNRGWRTMGNYNIAPGATVNRSGDSVPDSAYTHERWDNPFELPSWFITDAEDFNTMPSELFVKVTYRYMFDRSPSTTELQSGIARLSLLSHGLYMHELYKTPEFQDRYALGSKTNTEFLVALYYHVLKRINDPRVETAEAFNTLLSRLAVGVPRNDVAGAFFTTPELNLRVLDLLRDLGSVK